MRQEELERVLAIARDAAREAAAHVHRGYRRKVEVEHKGAVDLVTSFDRESETMLRARLAPCGYPVVGEEQGGQGGDGARFYVDPIDGTTNFVHGHPFWCVSIGLVEGTRPVLGVIVAPALGLEWTGITPEDGARAAVRHTVGSDDVEPCLVSAVARFDDALLATGFPYDRTTPDNNFDAFVTIKRRCQAVRRCGSAALDLCLVADGTYDGYWERRLNAWDIAGGSALVRAAGGAVTDYDGADAFIASGHVVASNGLVHGALLDELARVHSQRAPGAQ